MAGGNNEAARKQFGWLAFLASVIAGAGLVVPEVRNQLSLALGGTTVIGIAGLLLMAPFAAVVGGQMVLRIVLSCVGLLLGGSVTALLFHQQALTPALLMWSLSVVIVLALALARSPMRAWQAGNWE